MRRAILWAALSAIEDRVRTIYGTRNDLPSYLKRLRSRAIKALLPH